MASSRLTRRTFVAGTAAAPVVGAGLGFFTGPGALAQEATPDTTTLPAGPAPETIEFANDWPVAYQNNYGHRSAPTSTIDSTSVTTLGPAWRLPISAAAGWGAITGTPIVLGDVIYFQDMMNNFHAVNRTTGETIWMTEYNIPSGGPNGLCVGYGMVFGGLGESGDMVALDIETGTEVWHKVLTNHPYEAIRMAPTVYDGWVYISIVPDSTNGEPGARGLLHVLDAITGLTVWYLDLAEGNLWGNARVNMGAGLWYPPTFDDEGNVYFGNGNAAPWPGNAEFPAGSSRMNDNLYASTMMSVDPKVGAVRWHFLPKPFDLFDLDFQQAPVLVTENVFGVETKLAIGSGKTGDVIAIGADTGLVIWWTKVGKHQNDQLQQLGEEYVEVFPGSLGGVETPLAYKDGVLYVPVTNNPSYVNATGTDNTQGGLDQATGEIVALDAATGAIKWTAFLPTMPVGSIAIANDVLVTAGTDGLVRAFKLEDGSEVWNFQMAAGVNAPVVIVGDDLIVGAGTFFIAKPEQFEGGVIPEPSSELVLFKLGVGGGVTVNGAPASTGNGEVVVTPEATPAP